MSYYYYIIILLLLGACNRNGASNRNSKQAATATETEKTVKYVESFKLVAPQKNQLYSYHDEITFTLENQEGLQADSTEYFVNGVKIASTGKGIGSYVYNIPEQKTGTSTLKVMAWFPEGRQGIATTTIRVKPDKAPEKLRWKIVKTTPHDPQAYTQGLVYRDGFLYEGTGQYGQSSLRKTELATGKPLCVLSIAGNMFGEGVTIFNDKIYQITWRSRKGFVYDLKTFSQESTFTYNSEGWGITTVNDKLVMSDGSNKLYHIAPSTFNTIKEVEVYDQQGQVAQLNELEYVDGLVWANVWMTDRIVAIDPETGAVKKELDMTGLLSPAERSRLDDRDDVLNGIAYNPEKGTFYLTGKRWPKMFEISLEK